MDCIITPISAFQSTNLNSKIDCFSRLADRIVRAMGAPLVTVEIHPDQINENISIACEMFSKYAGYTNEYLILDSRLYQRGVGVRLDHLYTLANSNLDLSRKASHTTESTSTAPYLNIEDTMYVNVSAIPNTITSLSPELSASFPDGIFKNQILDYSTYNTVLTAISSIAGFDTYNVSARFISSVVHRELNNSGECQQQEPSIKYNNMFDYDAMDYRKVISVVDFEEGSTTGINTLFTIEQTLAQQTYFSYAMGNYGFDLISWWTVKNWLETREKVLATRRTYDFNERTQYLRIYPEPNNNVQFYALLNCYIEKPIRDLIKEAWVYQYSLALSKITVGRVRGKFSQVNVFGGQVFNTDILNEGLEEKKELERQLFENAAGFGDSDPTIFLIG